MKKWLTTSIIIIVVLAGIVWLTLLLTGEEQEVISTQSPEFREIRNTAMVTGSIEPNTEVELKSSVSGILDEIKVSVGDQVRRGDPVARIQIVPDPEQINNAERDLEIARLNYKRAKENYNRQKELYEGDVISSAEYEEALNNYEIREKEVKSAQNRLEIIREGATHEMKEMSNIITATMDGVVLSIPVKEGSSIMGRGNFNEGTSIMEIADMDNMVFQGQVSESDVGRLEPGMDMELSIGAIPGEIYNAVLGFIAPRGQEEEGGGRVQYSISALVEQKEGNQLRAGLSASADVIIEEKDSVLSVEERHLKFEDGEPYLMVETDIGEFEKRQIKTGISDGIHTEITEGLEADQKFKINDTRPAR